MRPNRNPLLLLSSAIAPVLLCWGGVAAAQDEIDPEIADLEKAAEKFVAAYNEHDAEAVAALYTEDGEIIDERDQTVTSGRAEILERYVELFSQEPVPSLAVEAESVLLVAPGLAVEDGTLHYSIGEEDPQVRSVSYTAVLSKGEDGQWRIASVRDHDEVTAVSERLRDLEWMVGDWTYHGEGLVLDLAIGWDDGGNYLLGDVLMTTPDTATMSASIRIGWNAATSAINWWIFDSEGGFGRAEWTPLEDGWLLISHGVTSDGEIKSATQTIKQDGDGAFVWKSTNRILGGAAQDDVELRIVRQAPDPAAAAE